MPRTKTSPARQLLPLLFVALSAETVVRPFVTPAGVGAQSALWALAISTSLLCALVSVFFRLVPDSTLMLLRRGHLPQAKLVLVLFVVSTAFGGAESLVTTERFYRYVSDEPTLSLITAALVLAAAAYAANRGALTMTRAARIVCILFLCSGILLAVSSAQAARLENLVYEENPVSGAWKWFSSGRILPAEILCFVLIKIPMDKNGASCMRKALVFSALFFAAVLVLEELVLGSRAGLQMQPVHTLARLGGLSVFKRFDALHVGLWLLALLTRQTLFLYGTCAAMRGILPEHAGKYSVPAALTATLAAAFAVASLVQNTASILLSISTAASLAAALLFAFCMGVRR